MIDIAELRETATKTPTTTDRELVWAAADEIERLRKIVKRLDRLAMSATGHIPNKGIGDDFRTKIPLCQSVDL